MLNEFIQSSGVKIIKQCTQDRKIAPHTAFMKSYHTAYRLTKLHAAYPFGIGSRMRVLTGLHGSKRLEEKCVCFKLCVKEIVQRN